MNRIEREKLVVRQMIAIYCHKHHAHNDNILCDDYSTPRFSTGG